MYLLDTDVLSALRKTDRHPQLVEWLRTQRSTDLYLSVISIGEIERGLTKQQMLNPEFAEDLSRWLDTLLRVYASRILDFTQSSARYWGRLSAAVGNNSADLLIAATALDHGLTVVSGNTRHFEPTGVTVFDPFQTGGL